MFAGSLQRVQAWLHEGCLLAVATPLLLVACGGGGGGGDPVNPNGYDLDAAITRAYTTGLSFPGLTATASNGAVITMDLSLTRAADAVFEGTLRHASVETIALSAPGMAPQTISATAYFGTNPFITYGGIDDTGAYGVFTSTGTLPTAAHVGDSGTESTGVYYADASKATVTMNTTTTWEMLNDGTDSTAWACSKTVAREVGSNVDMTQTLCFRIDTAGNVLAAKVLLVDPATGSLEFK